MAMGERTIVILRLCSTAVALAPLFDHDFKGARLQPVLVN